MVIHYISVYLYISNISIEVIFNAQRGVLIMMNAEHSDGKWGLKSVPCLKIMVYAKCLLQITTITTMTALNYLLKRTKTKQVILEFCIMLYMYNYLCPIIWNDFVLQHCFNFRMS